MSRIEIILFSDSNKEIEHLHRKAIINEAGKKRKQHTIPTFFVASVAEITNAAKKDNARKAISTGNSYIELMNIGKTTCRCTSNFSRNDINKIVIGKIKYALF